MVQVFNQEHRGISSFPKCCPSTPAYTPNLRHVYSYLYQHPTQRSIQPIKSTSSTMVLHPPACYFQTVCVQNISPRQGSVRRSSTMRISSRHLRVQSWERAQTKRGVCSPSLTPTLLLQKLSLYAKRCKATRPR